MLYRPPPASSAARCRRRRGVRPVPLLAMVIGYLGRRHVLVVANYIVPTYLWPWALPAIYLAMVAPNPPRGCLLSPVWVQQHCCSGYGGLVFLKAFTHWRQPWAYHDQRQAQQGFVASGRGCRRARPGRPAGAAGGAAHRP